MSWPPWLTWKPLQQAELGMPKAVPAPSDEVSTRLPLVATNSGPSSVRRLAASGRDRRRVRTLPAVVMALLSRLMNGAAPIWVT